MKKIITIVVIVVFSVSIIVDNVSINSDGVMIDFYDNTGYWIEF